MSSRAKVILAVVALVVVVGVVGLFSLSGGAALTIETALATQEDLAVTVVASGLVESGTRADVFPPTAGTLAEVNVGDGDEVRAGTVIAVMDREPLLAQVKQAEAAVAGAESQLAALSKQAPTGAELDAARAGTEAAWAGYQAALEGVDAVDQQSPSGTDLAAAQAASNAAYTASEQAKDAYELLKASIETSLTPQPEALAQLDAAELAKDQAYAGYLQAKAAYDQLKAVDLSSAEAQASAAADQAYAGYLSARAQQDRLEATSLSAEQRAAQASLDQARHALSMAQESLEDAELTAPIDGVVLFNALGTPSADGATPLAAAGSAVGPQSAPFTVVDLDGLKFSADVDEVDVSRIKLGMDGVVSLDAFSEESIEATVAEIEPVAVPTVTGGTIFPVGVWLSDVDGSVLIGMRGDIEIEVSSVPDAVTVPVEALFDEGGTAYVYLISGDKLARTEVEIGTITETRVQVLSGVDVDDEVALSGSDELVDGMPVTVAE